ncbi:hypothetical protein FBT96_09910 [Rhodobacter capsulatus]|uniref:A-factor biosynthesis hotdog domain-containing protein n=1 Tax=Rhodobacter capsulatus TaxID=1061 RepID=A0A4U1JR41_RHOCA|nr:AfsA-related hotdog domain-containing protein [Rhodobacter capsulatus]TKD18406.1 hypothetical protein FBT96_09910 [Rhodobacter capsulatus]
MKLVVGNRFREFAQATDALLARDALEAFVAGSAGDMYLGQGVSEEDAQIVTLLGVASGLRIRREGTGERRASREVSHKHRIENRLISHPRPVDADIFEADLLVDDRNEIMSDHVTGCHLQGMLLIEATRQMFIAVGETQYAHLGVPRNGYVVFDRIETRFEQFAFPLPARLRQTVTEATPQRGDRVKFAAQIEIFQPQGRVAVSEVSYTIFDAEVLAPKERKLAQRAVEAALGAQAAAVAKPERRSAQAQLTRAEA